MGLFRRAAIIRATIGLFLFHPILFAPSLLAAPEEEEFVVGEIKHGLESEMRWIRLAGPETPDAVRRLADLHFDATERVSRMQANIVRRMSQNAEFLAYLSKRVLPETQALANQLGVELSQEIQGYQLRRKAALDETRADEARLRNAYDQMRARHPEIRKILALASFSRSDTLGEGRIGAINPAAADEIQDSAYRGLIEVLEEIERIPRQMLRISIKDLQQYQSKFLGKAQHQRSAPGKIRDILFNDDQGKPKHVLEYLNELEARAAASRTLWDVFNAYQEFLHLHPFGDSNGRAAEIIKQVLLARLELPPLVTPEKTAVENFLFQHRMGGTPSPIEIKMSIQETLGIIEAWDSLLTEGQKIQNVELSGPNVVAQIAGPDGMRRSIIMGRGVEFDSADPRPPVRSMPVLADATAGEMKLRFTHDSWKSTQDISPERLVHPQRLGRAKVVYPFYQIEIPAGTPASNLSFAYYYDSPEEMRRVWFQNSHVVKNSSHPNPRLSTKLPFAEKLLSALEFRDLDEVLEEIKKGSSSPWDHATLPGIKHSALEKWLTATSQKYKNATPGRLAAVLSGRRSPPFRDHTFAAGGKAVIEGKRYFEVTESQLRALESNPYLALEVRPAGSASLGPSTWVRFELPSASRFEPFLGKLSPSLQKSLLKAKKMGHLDSASTWQHQKLTRMILAELTELISSREDLSPQRRLQLLASLRPFEPSGDEALRAWYQHKTGKPIMLRNLRHSVFLSASEFEQEVHLGEKHLEKIRAAFSRETRINSVFPKYYNLPELWDPVRMQRDSSVAADASRTRQLLENSLEARPPGRNLRFAALPAVAAPSPDLKPPSCPDLFSALALGG